MLSPNDHLRLMVELMKPLTPELARRWLAALLQVPEEERLALVGRVERSIVETYASTGPASEPIALPPAALNLPAIPPDEQAEERLVHVVHPPTAAGGHTEQVIRSYAQIEPKPSRKRAARNG